MKKTFNGLWHFLIFVNQILHALYDLVFPPNSYSQFGEDTIIYELIKKYNIRDDSIYIDIGANHPTRLSNTFYFYKRGFNGIIIEPNRDFAFLYRVFRKRDIFLTVGIGLKNGVAEYKYSFNHVLNSFLDEGNTKIMKKEYIPILRLESILDALKIKNIFLLSIDVEGLDYEVLISGSDILKNVFVICIEANTTYEKEKISNFLVKGNNFYLFKEVGCNLLFINRQLAK